MDSQFCSLTACLKNAKNTKGQSAICEGLGKYKKNTKIQIAFLDVMGKYKKNTKIRSVFFCILFVFFSYFFCVFTKKYEKNTKKNKKNTNAIAQKYKIQKKYESTISKIQNTKKIRTQNFKNTKYKEKTNSKISQRANPVFTFGNQEPKYKKIQNQPVVFSKPCSSDFVFLGCIFFRIFFVFLNIGRRPFCSHPGQLKAIPCGIPMVVCMCFLVP